MSSFGTMEQTNISDWASDQVLAWIEAEGLPNLIVEMTIERIQIDSAARDVHRVCRAVSGLGPKARLVLQSNCAARVAHEAELQ